MKKILIIPSFYPSSKTFSGSFFKDQALFLNRHGFDVKILMAEELHTKSYLFQCFKRLITNKPNKISTNFLNQDPEAYSFPLIIQKSWGERKKIFTLKKAYLKAFKCVLKSGWEPEVIHAQNTFRAGIATQYICETYNIPYVVIEHSPFRLNSYSDYLQREIKKALMSAEKVAGVSQYQKKCLLLNGINRPIEVVWNLVDETKFKILETIEQSKLRIVTITYSSPVKDVITFFKAISKFVEKNNSHSIEVIVIGGTSFERLSITSTAYFEKLAATQNIKDICTFIPYASQLEIKRILQSSDVFISTSIEETFGIAVREALLCGVLVIATKSGGVEDTLNLDTGILVEVGDFSEIALQLELIMNKKIQFDAKKIRNYVISQSGRAAFLNSMTKFYSIEND
ncbi:glycosyltransferase [Xanthomarina gelatinilytica]|uniref:glycosyltransferase n=1 Tax=Xanthomarina gelatinilytica TaxID=1137281 RepID=UPI003AA9C8E6